MSFVFKALQAMDTAWSEKMLKLGETARWDLATQDAVLAFPAAADTFSCAPGGPCTEERLRGRESGIGRDALKQKWLEELEVRFMQVAGENKVLPIGGGVYVGLNPRSRSGPRISSGRWPKA